jgi:PAS domain S-box-containing protein
VDIRTKLIFALVAVTLGSMLAFGAFMYMSANRMISAATADQLESLAESNEDAIESTLDGWKERVQLIASRTQLRLDLGEYNRTRDPETTASIQRILDDAAQATRSVEALAAYDVSGQIVARAGVAAASSLPQLPPRSTAAPDDEVLFLGASFTEDGEPRVSYSAPLRLEDERVGFLAVVLNARRLVELTEDYTGLGETGELLIVAPDSAGARTLHPVRNAGREGGRPSSMTLLDDEGPGRLALSGAEAVYRGTVRDYRGEPVWAATRFLPESGWGVVVKFDTAEKRAAILEFRDNMFSLALSLAGIGSLVAVLLGFRFAAPIHKLAEVAERLGDGDLDARVEVTREDEIGLLARTFNEMAGELQGRVLELHEYQKFFDVSLDLLCIAGTDGFFKRTNPAFERALGWTSEELCSQPFVDLVHPEDKEATQLEIEKLATGVPTISFVNRFQHSDGGWVFLRWNSYPEPETGLLYAIARQIKDPREA